MRVRWVSAGLREGCVVVAGWQAASGVGGMRESSGLLTDASSSGVRGADSMSSFPSGRRASRASWVVNTGRQQSAACVRINSVGSNDGPKCCQSFRHLHYSATPLNLETADTLLLALHDFTFTWTCAKR